MGNQKIRIFMHIRFMLVQGKAVPTALNRREERERLLLRRQRFFHPAIEQLLVGFNPTINVAVDVGF